ncbi:M48 family metallopeptidase [Frateuria defendens]|uniref:M48 family metallopeptidase n=1 Tax=Frateuria defendens TaxID=2219559 RepID=UPI00066FD04C|nr:YgjP-like metallopeptidase domain-containing protein [Frateuria defendens]
MAYLEEDWLELSTADGHIIRVAKSAHPRARRLRLTVTPKGARVSYPRGTHPAQVSAFLRSHVDWLERKLDELNLITRPLPALRVGHPTTLPLRGETVELDWAEGPYPRVEAQDGGLTLVIPRPHTRALPVARGLLASHFEAQMRRDVSRWLALYVPQLGLAPTALRIRPMKSLWGSLDTRDRINLDLALALAPPAALRYVLVHELCHLKVRNHAPRFWALVGSLLPEWRAQRDWLRQNGAMLKAELDRLVADVAD